MGLRQSQIAEADELLTNDSSMLLIGRELDQPVPGRTIGVDHGDLRSGCPAIPLAR